MKASLFLMLSSAWLLTNCNNKDVSPDCTRGGYIIGFDPCGGTGGKALVIALTSPRDTVLTYNFPAGIYDFPPALYTNYKSNFLFPDSIRTTYKVHIGFRLTPKSEKQDGICQGNIWLGPFAATVRNKQIIITCARKD